MNILVRKSAEAEAVRAALAAENAGMKHAMAVTLSMCRSDGMDTLIDTRHYCDTATATPAKAKKMAALIENWTPPDGWCNGNDRDWHEKMKGYICDFLRKCNGFMVM